MSKKKKKIFTNCSFYFKRFTAFCLLPLTFWYVLSSTCDGFASNLKRRARQEKLSNMAIRKKGSYGCTHKSKTYHNNNGLKVWNERKQKTKTSKKKKTARTPTWGAYIALSARRNNNTPCAIFRVENTRSPSVRCSALWGTQQRLWHYIYRRIIYTCGKQRQVLATPLAGRVKMAAIYTLLTLVLV